MQYCRLYINRETDFLACVQAGSGLYHVIYLNTSTLDSRFDKPLSVSKWNLLRSLSEWPCYYKDPGAQLRL